MSWDMFPDAAVRYLLDHQEPAMTNKTRRLIVTLPDTSGEEADTTASTEERALRRGGYPDATVTHALGETLPDSVRIVGDFSGGGGVVIQDIKDGEMIILFDAYAARQLAGALLAIPGVAEAEPPAPKPYVLHYVSQDPETLRWCVYAEDYASESDDEPIDGSQRHVATLLTEQAALHVRDTLQAKANA